MRMICTKKRSPVRTAGTFALLVLLMGSCSEKNEKMPNGDGFKVSNCLAGFDYRYDELLTKADVQKHLPIDEDTYKEDINAGKTYGNCRRSWNSDRPDLEMELLGIKAPYPDKNFVEVKMLSFYDFDQNASGKASAVDAFDRAYKKLSDEEYQQLLANLEKNFADNPSALETAKGLLDARRNSTYASVEGLGDRAYWNWRGEYGVNLVVLAGLAQFTIESRTSDDAASSLEVAVKMANEVLEKCN